MTGICLLQEPRSSNSQTSTALPQALEALVSVNPTKASVMRSAGLPVLMISFPINFAAYLIGSLVTWHYTA